MYILKEVYDLTYKKIGQIFNNKDHSTVIYSIEQISNDLQTDKDKKEDIEKLLIKCGKRPDFVDISLFVSVLLARYMI